MKEIYLTPSEQKTLEILEDLNKPRNEGITAGLTTRLHAGQIDALSNLYVKKLKLLMVPSGRKFGKSEVAIYALWKQALENPGSACYYITPESSHGRKLVWDTWRLQKFLGDDSPKYIKNIKNVEMKIDFKNGSFIQVIGSENFGSANGLTPHIAVYDEFKLFHPRWHVDFAPNLIPKAAPLLIIGTLPTPGDKNSDQYYEVLNGAKSDKTAAVVFKTTFDNPLNNVPNIRKALEDEINRLIERGEEDVVQREYYSKIIAGGKRSIFPMFERNKHVRPHQDIMNHIKRDYRRLDSVLSVDPGSSTVFGGVFLFLNRYTGTLYVVDELYQKSQKETSSGVIIPLIRSKCSELIPELSIEDDWLKVSDDAAVWFMGEAANRSDPLHFFPAEKWKGTRDEGLSLIKDMLIQGKLIISDRCENLITEMFGYAIDSSGKISNKIPDHNIDSLRYGLIALNYNFELLKDTIGYKEEIEKGRFRHLDHDISENGFDINEGIGYEDGWLF
jgi:hypothetical protein